MQTENNNERATALVAVGAFLQQYADWVLGVGVLALMLTLIAPVSPVILDVLVAVNITTSLVLLLVTMNVRNSAELSTFPTVLLFSTLFRLGLNVASTRLILSEGEAGSIIQAFGSYVVGNNLGVGMIVFLILIIIQFVVITKGSGRVSEVSARFVLDAMPGKQMAIDADLNGGLIDADQARFRREEIATEAEFYGAMDGASKFVRGDAIAGLIITALNLVGGVVLGSLAGLSLAEAGERYSRLTIGDGLVSQIPSLFISTAAAVLVTKETSSNSLGASLIGQVGGRPRATLIAAGMLLFLGLLPGMPATPFVILSALLFVAYRTTRGADGSLVGEEASPDASSIADEEEAPEEDPVEQLLRVDRISLEIGYRLIPLVQGKDGSGILDHIAQLRRRFAAKEGAVLPPVRIKDNVRMEPGAYRVLVGGQDVGGGTVQINHYLALDSGSAAPGLRGEETTDPTFGLPAWWISSSQREEAEVMGYTVIDPVSVLVTHLSEVVRQNLPDILTRDDVKDLIEGVKSVAPAVVEELVPDRMSYGEIQQVLRNLLREGVPIRNMPLILEALADSVTRTKDPETLSELVRQRLGRVLCELHADKVGTVHAVTLDPEVEARLASAVGAVNDPDAAPVNPAWLQGLVEHVADALGRAARSGHDTVVLARSNVRRFLNELLRATLPKVAVLSYNEVVPARAIETAEVVRLED